MQLQYFPTIKNYIWSLGAFPFDLLGGEPYQKMSFRNRCIIATANGPLSLSIPIQGGRSVKQLYREVRIDHSINWQELHWKSIQTAYGKSPWYFQYADPLESLYKQKYDRLIDWNLLCLHWVDSCLGFSARRKASLSTHQDSGVIDQIRPSNYHDEILHGPFPRYVQVFDEKTGFLPNLSILDFIFCSGKTMKNLLHS